MALLLILTSLFATAVPTPEIAYSPPSWPPFDEHRLRDFTPVSIGIGTECGEWMYYVEYVFLCVELTNLRGRGATYGGPIWYFDYEYIDENVYWLTLVPSDYRLRLCDVPVESYLYADLVDLNQEACWRVLPEYGTECVSVMGVTFSCEPIHWMQRFHPDLDKSCGKVWPWTDMPLAEYPEVCLPTFYDCIEGPGAPYIDECVTWDTDRDGDLDMKDWQYWQSWESIFD